MSMTNSQEGAGADRSPHLLRRVPADESEAHARRDLDDGSSHLLPRARARADEPERHEREDADPSPFLSLRRAPAKKAEAHARRDLDDGSSHLLPHARADEPERHDREDADPSPFLSLRRAPAKKAEAHDRWDADAGDPSSHFLGGAPANVEDGSSNLPPRAPDDVSERRYREDEDGDPSSSPTLRRATAKNAEGYDPADSNRLRQPRSPQVATSNTDLGPYYIDPDHIYKLYLGGQLKTLLEYMDCFPSAVNDFHYRMLKELVYISMRGDGPVHLKLQWNVRRAESARELAHRFFAAGINLVWCTKWLFWPELLYGQDNGLFRVSKLLFEE